jgi:NADH-quinone oxidoreductase subunit J
MTILQIIFLIIAAVTLLAALMVVTSRNLIHSALWLILSLFGVAVFYVLLNAGFFAVVQVVVYIGAIAILFIFAAMLTRRVMQDTGPQTNSNWWAGAIAAILMFAGVLVTLFTWPDFKTSLPEMAGEVDTLAELGRSLVSVNAYVIPFELASVLLVAAMIGAIYVSLEKKK